MTMIRRTVPMQADEIGPRTIRVRMSTEMLGRDNLVVVPNGISLAAYRANPIILWQHLAEFPIARATEVSIVNGNLEGVFEFAPEGISAKADEICGLVKAGIVNAASIGFEPLDMEPVDPKSPRSARRVVRSELMECSMVSIPADRGAVVLERDKEDDDGPPAARAAPIAALMRAVVSAATGVEPAKQRGLWTAAWLLNLLDDLYDVAASAKQESAREGDESAVPAALLEAANQVAKAALDMITEEIAEAASGAADEGDCYTGYDYCMAHTPSERRAALVETLPILLRATATTRAQEIQNPGGEIEEDEGTRAPSANRSERAAAARTLALSAAA